MDINTHIDVLAQCKKKKRNDSCSYGFGAGYAFNSFSWHSIT